MLRGRSRERRVKLASPPAALSGRQSAQGGRSARYARVQGPERGWNFIGNFVGEHAPIDAKGFSDPIPVVAYTHEP